MDRVVETMQVGVHEVVVVECLGDEGSWYRLVVDGVDRDGYLPAPPTAEDVAWLVLHPQET